MRCRALLPPALVLLLGRGPPPAVAQGTKALNPSQARNAFYCSGTSSQFEPDPESDDFFGDAGFQGISVHATSQAACTAEPAAALAAYLRGAVTAATLECGGPPMGPFGIQPTESTEAASQLHCAALAATLNRKLNTAAFSCRNITNPFNAFVFLVSDATECDAAVGTLNSDIFGVCDFYGAQYMSDYAVRAREWSSQHCVNVTDCSLGRTFQSTAPTLVTDRVCSICTPCGADVAVTSLCSLTADGVCGDAIIGPDTGNSTDPGGSSSAPSSSSGISIGDQVLIVLAASLALGVIAYLYDRQRGLTKTTAQLRHNGSLQERLLEEAHGDLDEAKTSITQMRGAWEIDENDLVVRQKLAEGAAGVVKAGSYAGHAVAIKFLRRPLDGDDPEAAAGFAREVETLMAIKHPQLVIFFGAGVSVAEGKPFMVTELMALGSLKHVLADLDRALGWGDRVRIARQVAEGMAYLHGKQIVHRDLKSDNVLLNAQLDAKVADFGTSKLVTASRPGFQSDNNNNAAAAAANETRFGPDGEPEPIALTATMTKGIGTPLWMAPELFVGGSRYGPAVDVYSYGIVLWELATRREPWDEIEAREYIPFYGALNDALEAGRRPAVTVELGQQHPAFLALMVECWATEPTARPGFAAVATLLATL